MKKEEKIREEWIKAIGYFPDDYCKETGYISGNSNSVYNYFEDFCLNKEDFDFKSENYGSLILWRPKSLHGIENNNGWLPYVGNSIGYLDIVYTDKENIYPYAVYINHSSIYEIQKITRYQPIAIPAKPIY